MQELPRTLKIATVWLLVGTLLFLLVQGWQHRQQAMQFRVEAGVIELRRGDDGHFHWPGTVDGVAVDFLIDTGATSTAIPARLATRLGLRPVGQVRVQTAAGAVNAQLVVVDLSLAGGVHAQRLRVVALDGLGEQPLLGMDVLGRLQWQQAGGVLRVQPR
jgi:aspartyl protease family protein